jgi:glyoxylase I family protein
MMDSIEELLKQYESGKLTRRNFLTAMTLLVAPVPSVTQNGLLKARSLNHLNVRVSDVDRSVAFYRKVFGLPAARPVDGAALVLDLPAGGFISLCPLSIDTCGVKANAKAGDIDHFDIGIDDYEAGRVVAKLKVEGIEASGEGSSVFIEDPDGANVQISAPNERFPVLKSAK